MASGFAGASAARILVVEDEQAIADAIQFSLEREGYDVATIDDGEAAVAKDIDAFDLVLLDLMLPRMPATCISILSSGRRGSERARSI